MSFFQSRVSFPLELLNQSISAIHIFIPNRRTLTNLVPLLFVPRAFPPKNGEGVVTSSYFLAGKTYKNTVSSLDLLCLLRQVVHSTIVVRNKAIEVTIVNGQIISVYQEPINRSMQLHYIPVRAFSQTDLFLDRISLELDSHGSAMTNQKKLI